MTDEEKLFLMTALALAGGRSPQDAKAAAEATIELLKGETTRERPYWGKDG